MKSKKREKYISITRRGKSWRVRVRVAPFCNTASFDTEHEARSWALVEKSRQVLGRDRRPPSMVTDGAAAALHNAPNRAEECGREIGIRPSSASGHAMAGVLVSTMLKSYVRHVSPRKASGGSDRACAKKLIAHFGERAFMLARSKISRITSS